MHILIPIDSSTTSKSAQSVAMQLAAGLPGSTLHVLHVVNVRKASGNILSDISGYAGFEPAIVSPKVYEEHEETSRQMVAEFVKQATEQGIKAEGHVVDGAVREEIVKASHRADIVVMGARGESEDRHPGQGGAQANNALPRITVPTFVVPKGIDRIEALALGYDGSDASARAMRAVNRLAPMGLPVHIMYVGDEASSVAPLDEAEHNLVGDSVVHRHILSGDSVHDALVKGAADAGAQVLALGFRGQNPLKDALFGSSGENIIDDRLAIALLVSH